MNFIKRITNWCIRNRLWFFFVACFAALITFLYLHGSVYRYVIHPVEGGRIIAHDERSLGTFKTYAWIAGISIFLSILSALFFIFKGDKTNKKEFYSFLSIIILLFSLEVASIVILGVFYV